MDLHCLDSIVYVPQAIVDKCPIFKSMVERKQPLCVALRSEIVTNIIEHFTYPDMIPLHATAKDIYTVFFPPLETPPIPVPFEDKMKYLHILFRRSEIKWRDTWSKKKMGTSVRLHTQLIETITKIIDSKHLATTADNIYTLFVKFDIFSKSYIELFEKNHELVSELYTVLKDGLNDHVEEKKV